MVVYYNRASPSAAVESTEVYAADFARRDTCEHRVFFRLGHRPLPSDSDVFAYGHDRKLCSDGNDTATPRH